MSAMSLFELTGRVAIVTGGVGLLGVQHCRALADAGAHVIVCDIDGAAALRVAEELGPQHHGLRVDVTDANSVASLRDEVMGLYDRIDVLVNNAAVNDMVERPMARAEDSAFEHYPLDLWKRVMDVNVTGVFTCCQIIGATMVAQGRGSIVNVASTYGVVAPDQSIYRTSSGEQRFYKSAAYPTSKGAVLMLTKYLATYWGARGVRVNALSPGGVENGQEAHFVRNYSSKTPMGRMADATDYLGAMIFLASDASAYMTGHNLLVDGGWTAW